MRLALSLRERLAALLLAAVLPLAAFTVWFTARELGETRAAALEQLRFAASLVAATQDRTIESAEHLLGAIAAMESVHGLDREMCETYFESLRGRFPVYSNIGLFDLDGEVRCQANGRGRTFNVASRTYFQHAVAQQRFVMGEPVIGRVSGRYVVPFARPVFSGDKIVGVVFATLDLERSGAMLGRLHLPPGARVTVIDKRRLILMSNPLRPPDAPKLAGAEIVEAAMRNGSGVGDRTDYSGSARVYGYAVSRAVDSETFIAVVSLSRDDIAAPSLESLQYEMLALAAVLSLGMVAAWFLGGRFIVKPAKQILGAVRRIEQGHLDARVPAQEGWQRGEFARIGAAFNTMAESLALRRLDLENELGRSRGAYALLEHVLNSMQEPLVAIDETHELLMYNEAARRLFPLGEGKAPLEHGGAAWGLYRPDGESVLAPGELPLARALRGESARGLMVFVRNALVPEGRMLQCSFRPIVIEGGQRAALAVYTDVTELRHLQLEQAAQFEQLRARERELHGYTLMLQRAAEAAQQIAGVPTLQDTLGHVAEQARAVIPSSIAVVGIDDGRAQGVAAQSIAHDWQGTRDFGPAGDRWQQPPAATHLSVPVTDRSGARIGMLQLAGKREGDYNERDAYVAMQLAQFAAVAIDNARLFSEISQLNASLEARIVERTASLARQEKLYRTLTEQAPEVVWNTDARGHVLFLNRAWYDLMGGTPADWQGLGWLKRVHPDDLSAVQANWENSRTTRQPYSGTRRFQAQDGSWHTMSYKAAPVLGADGEVDFWVGVDTDITGLKTIERALRSSNQELEAFSYSVSHDLRAPLGAIAGFSNALASKLASVEDEKARHYLARIQAGVKKMEELIEALLSLSRVARAALAWESVDLARIAADVIDELREQQPDRVVAVTIEPGLHVHGDPRLLRIVLQNLAGNAWKFTAPKGDAAQIEIGYSTAESAFYVRDNGVGFDMAYADKLFVAFQRLHTEREFPGTGIGLATVRRIIARHQGRVWSQAREGEGTTFFFTLGEAPPVEPMTGPDSA